MERANRETWAKRVGAWRKSGLTAGEFARKVGVSEGSLRWWSWRLGSGPRSGRGSTARPTAAPALSPLTFVEMTAAMPNEMLEVVLPSGTRVRVPAAFDVSAIERLLDVLQRR